MTPQLRTAVVRAAYGGVLAGLAAGIAAYSQGATSRQAIVAGCGGLVAYLIARGGYEGLMDSRAAA